jgi:hypothetical protein
MGGMNSALVFGRGTEAYMIGNNNAVKQERLRREHFRPLPLRLAAPRHSVFNSCPLDGMNGQETEWARALCMP